MTLDKSAEHSLSRIEMALDSLSLPDWLDSQDCLSRIYWSNRKGDEEIAAVGIADSVDYTNTTSLKQAVSTVEARLKHSDSQIRYVGGVCFDPEAVDLSIWGGFGPYRFIVPEYEIIRKDSKYTLAWNMRAGSGLNAERARLHLQEFRNGPHFCKNPTKAHLSHEISAGGILRHDTPCRSDWISLAEQLIRAIKAGHAEKVVLAQQADLVLHSPFNPISLLDRMKRSASQTYAFLYQFPDSGVFLGASPESLFRKDGSTLFTEAIAGTRPVHRDRATNLKLQHELRQSAKERQEHDFVADGIRAALETICDTVSCTQPCDILQAASVQHLQTRFRGELTDDRSIYPILRALHPTAAVNGTPSRKAMDQIRTLEPFSRGWYAGAVGWVMAGQAEFAVAIRSALVRNSRTISIYSGAGIVTDSDAEMEWEETESKKQVILDAVKEIG